MASRRQSECDNMGPIWRRSLLESEMRTPTTRLEIVVVVFLIAAVALLAFFLPAFLGSH